MKRHEVKTLPKYFDQVWHGDKLFELRKNDRGYEVGDTLVQREWDPETGYTGRAATADIVSIVEDETYLQPGYVALGLKHMYYHYIYEE